jgi:ATP-dependent exoDNAse (exonuclease V), alpha subunit - helicase superfamily I member
VLPGGTKLAPGTRLVNRLRRGEHLMVNYEYVVDRVLDDQVILKDETYGSVVTVPKGHVERHMHWSQTRTCHSLQGSSVSAKLVLFNLSSKRISPEFIYVALTRARDLKEVYFVEEEEDREVLPGALSFLMSLE